MRKLTDKEIRRLLARRETPEPPDGLADRIKAEIPEVLQVGGTGLQPDNVRAMPARSAGFRPLWLIAASLLVVIGVGFMVVRLLGPSENLARQIALDGVTIVKDVVVAVPERSTVEKQKFASATIIAKTAPPPAPQKARGSATDEPATLGKTLVAETGTRNFRGPVETETETPTTGVIPPGKAAGEALIAGYAAVSDEARSVAPADKMERAAAPVQAVTGSIIVLVRDTDGQPVVGASVRLDLGSTPDVSCGSRVAGTGGAATFCSVTPSSYRICAQLPGFAPASAEVLVKPGSQLTVHLTMSPLPADGKAHPWTCPTPRPPASR
jgi:hypothetical protein